MHKVNKAATWNFKNVKQHVYSLMNAFTRSPTFKAQICTQKISNNMKKGVKHSVSIIPCHMQKDTFFNFNYS